MICRVKSNALKIKFPRIFTQSSCYFAHVRTYVTCCCVALFFFFFCFRQFWPNRKKFLRRVNGTYRVPFGMIYKGMDGGRVIPRMRIIRRCVEMCIMLSRIVNRSYEIADETGEIKITDDHRLFNPILVLFYATIREMNCRLRIFQSIFSFLRLIILTLFS